MPTLTPVGKLDPVPANFFAPVETTSGIGEVLITFSNTPTLKRYIRFMRALGREGTTQDQTISSTQCLIRVRSDSGTITIKPDWRITHLGRTYGIVSINPIPHATGELELLLDSVIR